MTHGASSDERAGAPAPDERTTVPGNTPVGLETRRLRAALEQRLFGSTTTAPARIGRFVVLDRLGEGGMGTVWAAWDPELDRRVAIKVTRGRFDPERSVARMRREARALARLDHPNVVTVHEVDVVDDHLYIAMELVRGGTLGAWCEEHPASAKGRFAALLDLAIQAARGLAVVHGAGMVHRDLKPSNLLVDEHGRLCLTDFGLARLEVDGGPSAELGPASRDDAPADTEGSLTRPGEVLGTPAYMAPEQLEGRADALADQFSLCATLWEAAYGVRPFSGSTQSARLEAIAEGRPALPTTPPDVPAWFRAVLRRGLANDPTQRWPDVPALLRALERGRDRRRDRWLVLAGVLALVSGTGWATWDGLAPQRWCGSGQAALVPAWEPERRAAIARHHDEAVVDELGGHAAEWAVAYEQACSAYAEAVPDDRDRTPLEVDSPRLACLADAREQLGTVADELATTRAADHAALVRALPMLADCDERDVVAMRSVDPTLRTATPMLGRARVLLLAHRLDAAERVLDDAALALPDPWVAGPREELRAGLAAARGDHVEAERHAGHALGLAERVGDREGMLRAWLRLHAAAVARGRDERAQLFAERVACLSHRGVPASLRQAVAQVAAIP